MKIDNTTLRLDTAHRNFKGRTRYSSFNSSSSNNSTHHNHHQFNNSNSNLHHHHTHKQSHHHHHNQAPSHPLHGSQQHHQINQPGQNSKLIHHDQNVGGHQASNNPGPHGVTNDNSRVTNQLQHGTSVGSNVSGPNVSPSALHNPHSQNQMSQHPPRPTHVNHSLFGASQQKINQSQGPSELRTNKQLGHNLGGDDSMLTQGKPSSSQTTTSAQHPPTARAPLSQSQTQPNLSQVGPTIPNSNITTTSTAPTTLPSNEISHSTSALQSNQHNMNASQPLMGPDMRAYGQTPMMDNPHLICGPEQPSMMPPSSVYGHMYPYGPPPTFGYMPTPPQPNPVIPISAVPPAPPNQSSSGGVGQQQHPLAAANTNRYNSPHQQHQTQTAHADANAMNAMTAAGVPAQHQAPFYYYYPSPLYFDQTGAAAPNMYHPQSFHPQFFALPNPAYLPNAHTYPTQHPTQSPIASQSDAGAATLVNQQPPPPLPPNQQQVNLRNRDIDAPIE